MIKKETWEIICIHIWLIMSSYGIIFALLSFFEDIGILTNIKQKYIWFKGVLSILLGLIFYRIVGLPHINGTKIDN